MTGVNDVMDMNMVSNLENERDTDPETSALPSNSRMHTSCVYALELEEILQDVDIGSSLKNFIIQTYAERVINRQVNKRVRDESSNSEELFQFVKSRKKKLNANLR
ncbi:hypothetical protein ANN_23789 [Periplaneta americana]|uniref:Uncharacterized protein n=1 Tax=Periplaneta americana TaxID=6978 RepID=A0ABQ8SND9_PERAM|nr:hypothetical protein ANN_23789 [Periplaneta americana]